MFWSAPIRRTASGCWHRQPLDYRAIVYTGSRWDDHAAQWLVERGATSVAVGGAFRGARAEVRYDGEDDARVALLTEPLVAELLAAAWWQAASDQYGESTSPIST
jgi:glutamine---fructose-6-phosphate transaminase (isomerizing)